MESYVAVQLHLVDESSTRGDMEAVGQALPLLLPRLLLDCRSDDEDVQSAAFRLLGLCLDAFGGNACFPGALARRTLDTLVGSVLLACRPDADSEAATRRPVRDAELAMWCIAVQSLNGFISPMGTHLMEAVRGALAAPDLTAPLASETARALLKLASQDKECVRKTASLWVGPFVRRALGHPDPQVRRTGASQLVAVDQLAEPWPAAVGEALCKPPPEGCLDALASSIRRLIRDGERVLGLQLLGTAVGLLRDRVLRARVLNPLLQATGSCHKASEAEVQVAFLQQWARLARVYAAWAATLGQHRASPPSGGAAEATEAERQRAAMLELLLKQLTRVSPAVKVGECQRRDGDNQADVEAGHSPGSMWSPEIVSSALADANRGVDGARPVERASGVVKRAAIEAARPVVQAEMASLLRLQAEASRASPSATNKLIGLLKGFAQDEDPDVRARALWAWIGSLGGGSPRAPSAPAAALRACLFPDAPSSGSIPPIRCRTPCSCWPASNITLWLWARALWPSLSASQQAGASTGQLGGGCAAAAGAVAPGAAAASASAKAAAADAAPSTVASSRFPLCAAAGWACDWTVVDAVTTLLGDALWSEFGQLQLGSAAAGGRGAGSTRPQSLTQHEDDGVCLEDALEAHHLDVVRHLTSCLAVAPPVLLLDIGANFSSFRRALCGIALRTGARHQTFFSEAVAPLVGHATARVHEAIQSAVHAKRPTTALQLPSAFVCDLLFASLARIANVRLPADVAPILHVMRTPAPAEALVVPLARALDPRRAGNWVKQFLAQAHLCRHCRSGAGRQADAWASLSAHVGVPVLGDGQVENGAARALLLLHAQCQPHGSQRPLWGCPSCSAAFWEVMLPKATGIVGWKSAFVHALVRDAAEQLLAGAPEGSRAGEDLQGATVMAIVASEAWASHAPTTTTTTAVLLLSHALACAALILPPTAADKGGRRGSATRQIDWARYRPALDLLANLGRGPEPPDPTAPGDIALLLRATAAAATARQCVPAVSVLARLPIRAVLECKPAAASALRAVAASDDGRLATDEQRASLAAMWETVCPGQALPALLAYQPVTRRAAPRPGRPVAATLLPSKRPRLPASAACGPPAGPVPNAEVPSAATEVGLPPGKARRIGEPHRRREQPSARTPSTEAATPDDALLARLQQVAAELRERAVSLGPHEASAALRAVLAMQEVLVDRLGALAAAR